MADEDDATPCLHHEEEVGHMEATTTTTPTSHERENKGIDIGVCDAMIPLVDMMSDCLHAMDATFDIAYESFTFPCDTLPLHHVDHEDLIDCNDIAIGMPCYECFTFSPIACNMSTNCSFPCIACNDDNDTTMNMLCTQCLNYSPIVASKMLNNCSFQCLVCNNVCMFANEIAPIAFSNFGEFSHVEHVPISCLHFHHAYYNNLLDANGDVQIRRRIMMDDVFIYHAHTYFLLSMVCVGTRNPMSTSIEHELTKRALESIIQVSSRSNPALIPFPCFASNKNGHVTDDVLLYHAHTYVAWSLLCEGTIAYSSTSTEHELTNESFNELLGHRCFTKVNSIYLNNHAMIFEHWLLFECCFAFIVSFLGFIEGEVTIKSCHILDFKIDYMANHELKFEHLPPPQEHGAQESRTTLFQAGGDDVARPKVVSPSWTSLKADATEAWKRRKKREDGAFSPAVLPPKAGGTTAESNYRWSTTASCRMHHRLFAKRSWIANRDSGTTAEASRYHRQPAVLTTPSRPVPPPSPAVPPQAR